MTIAPVATDDSFVVAQGPQTTTFSGHLGADNGSGADSDPDGTLLGWITGSADLVGDGIGSFGASFIEGELAFLEIWQSGYVTRAAWVTDLAVETEAGGRVILKTDGSFTYTAPEGFVGADSFGYRLVDGDFNVSTATATILVAPLGALLGTILGEEIAGTEGGDVILALAGDDSVLGGGGADSVCGGAGEDRLLGEAAADRLSGGAGADRLWGGGGGDDLLGGGSSDVLRGGGGNDRLTGGSGNDQMCGGLGADQFVLAAPRRGEADRILDFGAQDVLAIDGDAFGLEAGALPQDWFARAGAGRADHARFLLSADGRTLLFDADGDAATANIGVAVFAAPVSLSADDFVVL